MRWIFWIGIFIIFIIIIFIILLILILSNQWVLKNFRSILESHWLFGFRLFFILQLLNRGDFLLYLNLFFFWVWLVRNRETIRNNFNLKFWCGLNFFFALILLWNYNLLFNYRSRHLWLFYSKLFNNIQHLHAVKYRAALIFALSF